MILQRYNFIVTIVLQKNAMPISYMIAIPMIIASIMLNVAIVHRLATMPKSPDHPERNLAVYTVYCRFDGRWGFIVYVHILIPSTLMILYTASTAFTVLDLMHIRWPVLFGDIFSVGNPLVCIISLET